MVKTLIIKFYCTGKNRGKMSNIIKDLSIHKIPESNDLPFEAHYNTKCTDEDLKLFAYIWKIVRKYADTALYVNASIQTKEQAEKVFDWIRCYNNRQYFHDTKDYCCIIPGNKELHGWGCKQLHSVLLHGRFGRHNGTDWWKIGPFEDGIQYIDKESIREMLENEANLKNLTICPLFSLEKASNLISKLPEQIDIKKCTKIT